MNILAPVSTIMTKSLITVNPKDNISKVKEIFDHNSIHHLPVVNFKELVGLISKTDLMYFLRGFGHNQQDSLIDEARLKAFHAEDIMTKGLAKVTSSEPIRTVLEIFKVNRFHAVPVVDQKELVGIVTTYDIIKKLADDPISLKDYDTQK